MLIPKNYSDAMDMGYVPGDMKLSRGYVSHRNSNAWEAEIHTAKGKRKGELYILLPGDTYNSCYRLYLIPPNKKGAQKND